MAARSDLLQGTLDLLILKAVSLGPLHGLGVSRRIAQLTRNEFLVKPGSLFPALHRLEQKGWLRSEWGQSESNRKARYYELTASGRRQLKAEMRSWLRVSLAINRSLASS
ncbi:MAG TPA: PadR family transcriptional regulator [Gemmatimonadales bacterium]|nr:PadR family transcriptional regulator [Gemmatimonadales bacterium]